MQQTHNLGSDSQNQNGVSDLRLKTTSSLIDYIEVIFHSWRTIFKITAISTIIAVVFTLFLPNIYTSTTMILPAQEDRSLSNALMAQFGGLLSMAGGVAGAPTAGELYVTMLNSETVMDPVVERFKLMEAYNFKYRSDAYKQLDNATNISLGRKDGVISISVSDKDPKRAADIANAYVEELGKLAVSLSVSGAGKNRIYLEPRLAEAKAGLSKAEDELKTFQLKNKTIQVPHQAEATIRGVAEMKAALVMKEVELSTARRSLTENSQEVKNLKTVIANLNAQISSYESGKGGGAIPGLGSVPQLGQDYVRLMRAYKIQEAMVELLTKQYEMTKLNEAKDYSSFQILQAARVPEKKSKPQRLKIVILVTVSTFLIMVFSVFLRDFWTRIPEEQKHRITSMIDKLKASVKN